MDDKKINEIPYGISDYERIVEKNYYYVDKTPYLHSLEKTGEYLFLIRPRKKWWMKMYEWTMRN